MGIRVGHVAVAMGVLGAAMSVGVAARGLAGTAGAQASAVAAGSATERTLGEADCAPGRLGTAIPTSSIGEPVSDVTLSAPVWTPATTSAPAYCTVTGAMAPVDRAATARPINFRVVLPASWSLARRSSAAAASTA